MEQIKKSIRDAVTCEDQLAASLPEFGLWDFFHRNVFHSAKGEECIPVIILDQFEEIYTLTDSDHKSCIIDFFSELTSLLNDIKPDAVAEYEQAMAGSPDEKQEQHTGQKGLVLKRSRGKSINFLSGNDFRLVICLREDKLYLLERNSANMPSLKNNRYNLRALSPQSAIEVVMCPRPDLFSNEEAITIVDKIADMGEEGKRTVDPAILSLFLYKYFEKKGTTNYDNIFTEYYRESTKDVKTSSIAYLENHLLTLGGYRNQIPFDDAINSGVSRTDIQKLLEKVILRTEKRKNIDYIEFSHDRLCEEAKRSRDERNIAVQKKAVKKRIVIIGLISGGIIVLLLIIVSFFANMNNELKNMNNVLEVKNKEQKDLNDTLEKTKVSLQNSIKEIEHKNESLNKLNDSLAYLIKELKSQKAQNKELKDTIAIIIKGTNDPPKVYPSDASGGCMEIRNNEEAKERAEQVAN
ncbi:MAG: hypothetical protein MR517_05745 [Bacteroidales bacterium]|nr:hypothetical protein [Bacteroidales bacterium]